ncbi:FG-GAP repeat protein [Tenggerimyces flavus]|uniref:FG-GAP repeat protein n=1 Tax=Tenggerimyces flavus TaxID=1708749 RepID=A0ABV7Y366_9ACTN|nr:FG-GAP repeat protein [Tenggerimyces flavus]MBM7790898.1 hypothetical protein [Tenggerimyces flavus]
MRTRGVGWCLAVVSVLIVLPAGSAFASPDPDRAVGRSASTDFNCDGYADLAIGVPYDAVDGVEDSGGGAVEILYGGTKGLSGKGAQYLTRDTPGVPGTPAPNESFGGSVAAGDFDGDGCSELVVGAPGTDGRASEVLVFEGASAGVEVSRDQPARVIRQGALNVGADWNPAAKFGSALAVGDFDGDGRDDLAVGAPDDNVDWMFGAVDEAGSVTVLYGTPHGLPIVSSRSQYWNQNSEGVPDAAEPEDGFGSSLAAGDFDGDGAEDLAIGVPGEGVRGIDDAGAVQVLSGSSAGLVAGPSAFPWSQGEDGVADVAEDGDRFGESLAAGDFGADGHDDLAVGARFEGIGAARGAGEVDVIEGSAVGLVGRGGILHQDLANVLGIAEAGDVFGTALAAADFNGDGACDLAVGAPSDEDTAQGSVTVFYGSESAGRLTVRGNVLDSQDSGSVPGEAGENESFGEALAANDFDRDGRADLVVGVPNDKRDAGASSAGVVNVLYGSAKGVQTTSRAQLWFQGSGGLGGKPTAFEFFGSALY